MYSQNKGKRNMSVYHENKSKIMPNPPLMFYLQIELNVSHLIFYGLISMEPVLMTNPIFSLRRFLMTSLKKRKNSKKSFIKLFGYFFSLFKHKKNNLRVSKTLCNTVGYFFPFSNDVIRNLLHDNIQGCVVLILTD